MSLERVRTLLGKFGLTKSSDELAIQIISLGPYIFFTDASGDNFLIVSEDYASRCLNSISFRLGSLTRETFWSEWLDTFMRYPSFDGFWGGLRTEPLNVSMAVPRTSETIGIGRAKRINRDWWLFEAETGEYAIPVRSTAKLLSTAYGSGHVFTELLGTYLSTYIRLQMLKKYQRSLPGKTSRKLARW